MKDLAECPFEVVWQAVVSVLQFQSPEINGKGLKETLKRKELLRTLVVSDLLLRLDPASPLGAEVRAAMEAHVTTGATLETYACVRHASLHA